MWRDLKVRYKQTLLGAGWVVLQPILADYRVRGFLGKLIKVPSDGVPYPIFAYSGLLLWIFVSNAVLSSCYSLVINAHIITRIYFSRVLIPTATVGVRLVDLIIAAAVLDLNDALLPDAFDLEPVALPFVRDSGRDSRVGDRHSGGSLKRSLSRRGHAGADSASGLDVCFTARLLLFDRAGEITFPVFTKPARRFDRWVSRRSVQFAITLDQHDHLGGGDVAVADFRDPCFQENGGKFRGRRLGFG